MRRRVLLTPVAAAIAIALTATPSRAQDPGPATHLRADSDTMRLFHDLLARSPTARDMVEVLEQSDVVVYIRQQWFPTNTLRGRTGCVASSPPRRILVIDISSRMRAREQLVALGHELRHALEIAGAPSVCDAESLSSLYSRIGEMTGYDSRGATFETQAAADAGERVRQELGLPLAPAVLADTIRN